VAGIAGASLRILIYLAAVFFILGFVASVFAAQRAFIAADIAALPFALSFLFLGLMTLGSVDLRGPGPFVAGANTYQYCSWAIAPTIATAWMSGCDKNAASN